MDLGLAGKTAIVTGGASNIGRAIVLALAKHKANTLIADVDASQAGRTADEANRLGGRSIFCRTDVTDWNMVQSMVAKGLEEFKTIEILVNNVGMTRGQGPLSEKTRGECEYELALNFWSVINCTRAVCDHMIRKRYGTVINIGSGAGVVGAANAAVYSAAKGAIISLSRALAKELGCYGININVVCPGWTVPKSAEEIGEMSFWRHHAEDYGSDFLQRVANLAPLGKTGNADDIGNLCAFLASDCASHITGQTISADGGLTMP